MARATQSIVSTYSALSAPTNPFTQVNFAPNKSEGVTSYDNAELTEALAEVYTYAQQSESYLMPLFSQDSMGALFREQDTFNKVNFVQKTEESPHTPLYVPSGGTRAHTLLQYHQAIQISQTIDAVRRYSLTANAQMQLAKALARLYDKGILWALTKPVLSYASAAAAAFKGVRTATVVSVPRASHWIHGAVKSSALTLADPSTALFDDLALHLENKALEQQNLWVIGGPTLRRKLRAITDFRDREKTISFNGVESSRYINWNGFNFVFMGPETIPDKELGVGQYADADGGEAVASTVSGAVQVAKTHKPSTFVVADLSTLKWGTAPFADRMHTSLRDDISYTLQFYTEVGFGGMRLDDNKLMIVTHAS